MGESVEHDIALELDIVNGIEKFPIILHFAFLILLELEDVLVELGESFEFLIIFIFEVVLERSGWFVLGVKGRFFLGGLGHLAGTDQMGVHLLSGVALELTLECSESLLVRVVLDFVWFRAFLFLMVILIYPL
jgi:hypothetical protein